MNLSIIIINYNVKEFLQNLLHSIEKATSNITKEIIIVDNASDDGSVELISEKFPEVKLIVNNKNLGFGAANNQALKIAKGDFILMINPDSVVQEDTFVRMIKFFKDNPEAGLAGCKILNPDGSLQLACRRSFPGPWTSFTKVTGLSRLFPKNKLFARYNLTYLDENKTYEVDAISGSFMMLKRDVLDKVNGFDEDFFMYGEDLDLCYRIQKAGYKVFYVHSTQIIHYKGESTKRSSLDETKVFYDAMHLFVKKHLSSSFLVEIILRTAIAVRKVFAFVGKRKLALISAVIDFLIFNLCLFMAEQIYMSLSTWVGFNLEDYLIIYSVPAIIHIITASLTRVYKRDTLSVLRNFLAIIISFIILTSITFFFKQFAYSRAVVLITYLLLLFSTTLWRFLIKLIFKVGVAIDDVSRNRTLIVGTENFAIQIAEKIKQKRTEYHSVVGLVAKYHNDIGKSFNSFKVIGSIENIKKVINEYNINEVIFSSKDLDYSEMMGVVSDCRSEAVEFKISGSELEFIVGKTSVSMLDDIPLVEVQYNISSQLMRFIKRTFDIIAGLLVLLFIYPFIYLISKMNKKKTDFRSFILNVPSVIRGKKSFVGPKSDYSGKRIFMGRQGLTGFWYIDNDSNVDFEKLDFYYAKNQNIWLDLEILGRTFNKMWNKRD